MASRRWGTTRSSKVSDWRKPWMLNHQLLSGHNTNSTHMLADNILTNCQISMSLEQLLALVPCFRNHLEQMFHPSVNEEPKPTI
jgi:hypothetical protein